MAKEDPPHGNAYHRGEGIVKSLSYGVSAWNDGTLEYWKGGCQKRKERSDGMME
jgi:hypothetical protein